MNNKKLSIKEMEKIRKEYDDVSRITSVVRNGCGVWIIGSQQDEFKEKVTKAEIDYLLKESKKYEEIMQDAGIHAKLVYDLYFKVLDRSPKEVVRA